ncbi:Hypp6890 [Branchiostoma lanceolatum]|uniref:ribonuclease H n=1 Tax=Branchiostoma lanceolatum TaxID=7740 RepID=A0A8K0E5C3_BRALA|nr:Hypp6890 [Branchiostoma lanceolatum]
MEGLQDLKSLIRPGDWMTSLDIQDAYFHIPIHPSFRKLLRFQFQSRLWEFQVCPFGLNCIPRAFTKITKPIIAVIRSQGIRIIIYLDDILILSTSAQECRDNLKFVIDLLTSLGFLLNWEKSQLIPTQKITFLGMVIDSLLLTFSLPEEKVKNLVQICSSLQGSQQISLRQLARVLGKMTAQWNGKVFVNPQGPILTITSDASLQGWGATCENNRTGGRWSLSESKLHINELELKAAFFALQCFAASRKNSHVHLRIDNTSAVAYINHQGGCKSLTLCKTARDLWKWSLARGLTISAEHIPGVQNEEADTASRAFQDTTEWSLHPDLFRLASRQLGFLPEVDLFASRLNTKLPKFCSWKPDPLAWKVDAFTWPWNGMKVYIFPPSMPPIPLSSQGAARQGTGNGNRAILAQPALVPAAQGTNYSPYRWTSSPSAFQAVRQKHTRCGGP